MLESNHPKLKTKKGFAQISKDSQVLDLNSLKIDDIFQAQSENLIISAKVIKKEDII